MAEKTATVIAESPDQTSFDAGWDDPEFGDKKETKDTPLEEKVETETPAVETETPKVEADPPAVETKPPAVETDPPAVEETPAAAKDKPTDYKPDFDRILGKVEEYKTETKAEIKSEVERIMGVGRTAGKGRRRKSRPRRNPLRFRNLTRSPSPPSWAT